MAAQHKRPGREAKNARRKRVCKNIVDIRYPGKHSQYDGISAGRLVIYAEIHKEAVNNERNQNDI